MNLQTRNRSPKRLPFLEGPTERMKFFEADIYQALKTSKNSYFLRNT